MYEAYPGCHATCRGRKPIFNLNMLIGCRMRRLILLLSFLDTLCTRVGISQGHNQAYLADQEVRYVVGSDGSFTSESHTLKDEHEGFEVLKSPIRFEPPELDFKEQPIGLPVLRKVTVYNLNAQSSIQMLSISGNTIHFHCSFFADKVIPPSGNTSFDVVFLGRDEGPVENTLYIHTSAGSFRFHVKATGTPNPYRLRPLVGVKMPLNSSYTPLIQLHNPHPEPIQVLEMYSSGGDLHLELPGGEAEGPQTLWQIPPFQTKSVMKANFIAQLENNHTAYIRIKTNSTGAEFLYLPLEVEVSSQPGIYCPQELLDFGLIPSNSDPKTLKLFVLNSGQRAIPVQNVIATPVSEAVSIIFRPQKISPDTLRPTVIADVTFDPSIVTEDGVYYGKVVIKSKNSQFKLMVPYQAHVLTGKLSVDESITTFHLANTKDEKMTRNFTVKNYFKRSVAVHNITLPPEARKFFDLSNFSPKVIPAGKTKDLFELSLKKEAWTSRLLDSYVTLHTNISNMNIPLICYHGKVEQFFPDSPSQSFLDFGTLGMEEKRDLYFTILNKNPVTLNLKNWGANLTGSLLELMGVEKGGKSEVMRRANFTGMARGLKIPPGHYMVFRVGILTPTTEGETNGTVFVETEFELLDIQFKFRVAKGSLSTVPGELIFDPAFPGKTVSLKLKVFSSFLEEMITDSVSTKPPNHQFSFEHAMFDGRSSITSSEKSFIGHVKFDPGAECRKDDTCYAGFSLNSKIGKDWFHGASLPGHVAEQDAAVAYTLFNRFRSCTTPSASFNITLNLDTNKVRGFLFKARAKLVWPTTVDKVETSFPLTQVGNSSTHEVLLNNPTDHVLYVHLVPFASYPDAERMIAKLMPAWATSHLKGNVSQFVSESGRAFKILNIQDDSDGTLVGFSEEIERRTGHLLNSNTKAFKLAARHRAKIRIKFQPDHVGDFNHGLFIRNNLTGIELVTFKGASANGEFQFGKFNYNKESESDMTLEFDMKEKHLKDCDRSRQTRYSPPILSVKRSIKLKNTGNTSIYIRGFEIEGAPCEGYGFKILNCDGFDLPAKESKDIDIAFSPDFTLAKVNRRLTILSNIVPDRRVNYSLVATLPSHMLAVCGSAIPRPTWEPMLYYSVNTFMIFVLVIVVVVAFLDADRYAQGIQLPVIVQNKTNAQPSQQGEVFDLRKVGERASQEFASESRSAHSELRKRAVINKKRPPSASGSPVTSKPENVQGWNFYWITALASWLKSLFDRPAAAPSEEPSPVNRPLSSPPALTAAENPPPSPNRRNKNKNGKNQQRSKKPATRQNRSSMDDFETSSTTTEGSNQEESIHDQSMDDLRKLANKKRKDAKKQQQQHQPQPTKAIKKKDSMADLASTKPNEKKPPQQQPPPPKVEQPKLSKKVRQVNKTRVESDPHLSSPVFESERSSRESTPPPTAASAASPSPILQAAAASSEQSFISATSSPVPAVNHQLVSSKSKKVSNVPVGKILPEVKKPENKFGAVGTKPLVVPPTVSKPCFWNEDAFGAPRMDPRFADLPPAPVMRKEEDFRQAPPVPPTFSPRSLACQQRSPTRGAIGGRMGDENGLNGFMDHQAGGYQQEESLMKSLQKERRQRTEEYLSKTSQQTDWPGFDNSIGNLGGSDFIADLWDNSSPTVNNEAAMSSAPGPSPAAAAQSVGGGWGTTAFNSVWPPKTNTYWPIGTNNVNTVSGNQNGGGGGGYGTLGGRQFSEAERRNVLGLHNVALSSIWDDPPRNNCREGDPRRPQQQHQPGQQQPQPPPDSWNMFQPPPGN